RGLSKASSPGSAPPALSPSMSKPPTPISPVRSNVIPISGSSRSRTGLGAPSSADACFDAREAGRFTARPLLRREAMEIDTAAHEPALRHVGVARDELRRPVVQHVLQPLDLGHR